MQQILLILLLVSINAFFAASEMAIVSLNKNKIAIIAEEGNKRAKTLLILLEEPSRFLATIQVGITLTGFLASAAAATTIAEPFAQMLKKAGLPATKEITMLITTLILAYATLVLGELFPKRIALQNTERIALSVAKPIMLFSKISLPFVNILTASTNILMRIFGNSSGNIEEQVSEEEIRMMIDVGEENGVLNETEKEMIDGIFDFDDILAKEVMTPRTEVFALEIGTPIEKITKEVSEEQYSRIPIYDKEIDHILGILYMKDLFQCLVLNGRENTRIKDLLKPAYFVPETKNIDTLFRELQSTKNHMAVLIDEYGGVSGIVTIEDLIEQIVGNIFDEHDEVENDIIKKIDENTFLVDGMSSIEDLNETLHLNIPSENTDTIAGFVLDVLGRIPSENEDCSILYEGVVYKVKEVKDRQIKKIEITTKHQ